MGVRLLREIDPEGTGRVSEADFVLGMRLICHVGGKLDTPLLTYMSTERKRLLGLFHSADIDHDGYLDLNEWMLMLSLQTKLLPSLKADDRTPHRNKLLRALRREKRDVLQKKGDEHNDVAREEEEVRRRAREQEEARRRVQEEEEARRRVQEEEEARRRAREQEEVASDGPSVRASMTAHESAGDSHSRHKPVKYKYTVTKTTMSDGVASAEAYRKAKQSKPVRRRKSSMAGQMGEQTWTPPPLTPAASAPPLKKSQAGGRGAASPGPSSRARPPKPKTSSAGEGRAQRRKER